MKHNQEGLIHFLTLLLIILFIWLTFNLIPSSEQTDSPATTEAVQESADSPPPQEETKQIITLSSLVAAIPGTGKATKETVNGRTFIEVSVALPNPFETTYYEAWLEGPNTISLGRMSSSGGAYKASYDTLQRLDEYKQIRISVDGGAATIEGLAPPFDVMNGEF